MNRGGVAFEDVSAIAGVDSDADGRPFALLDYDRDGWQDFVVVNANSPQLEIFGNRIGGRNANNKSIAFRLVGGQRSAEPSSSLSNRDGIGAVIRVYAGGRQYVRVINCGEGFAAQNSRTILVGIGQSNVIEKAEIAWPSGQRQTISKLVPGTINTVGENGAHLVEPFETVEHPPVRPFELTPLAKFNLKDSFEDKPTVYITTATWCAACKKMLPQVAMLKERFGDQFHFVGLPVDPSDSQDKIAAYVQAHQPAYDIKDSLLANDRTIVSKMAKAILKRDALPCTFLAQPDGTIVFVKAGVPSVSEIAQLLIRLKSTQNVPEQ